MGTINSDKLNDLVLVSEEQTSFQVAFQDSSMSYYTMSDIFTFSECPEIQSVVTGKEPIRYQRLLLVCQNATSDASSTWIIVLNQTSAGNFQIDIDYPLNNFEIEFQSQPFFADINGDLKKEIIYNDPDGSLKIG